MSQMGFKTGPEKWQESTPLFEHLVGAGVQCRRYCDAKSLGGAEIEHQLECGWLLHGKVCRLGPFEDATGITAGLVVGLGDIRSVTYQSAGLDKFTERIDGRNSLPGGY